MMWSRIQYRKESRRCMNVLRARMCHSVTNWGWKMTWRQSTKTWCWLKITQACWQPSIRRQFLSLVLKVILMMTTSLFLGIVKSVLVVMPWIVTTNTNAAGCVTFLINKCDWQLAQLPSTTFQSFCWLKNRHSMVIW